MFPILPFLLFLALTFFLLFSFSLFIFLSSSSSSYFTLFSFPLFSTFLPSLSFFLFSFVFPLCHPLFYHSLPLFRNPISNLNPSRHLLITGSRSVWVLLFSRQKDQVFCISTTLVPNASEYKYMYLTVPLMMQIRPQWFCKLLVSYGKGKV